MQHSILVESFTILFREGLEALLVVAALAAFLRRAGAPERIASLYAGAGAALVASVVMAAVFLAFFDGAHNDLVEAAVMIMAAGLILYMSGWLFVRQDPKAWQAELNAMAGRALASGAALSFAGIAFLAVFREGAETILFLQALSTSAGGFNASIMAGIVLATVALAAVFVAMQWLALRIPLRPIFVVTSAFLFLIGLKLIGEAIQELQEQAILPVDTGGVPGLFAMLGLNASWQAIVAQFLVIAIAVVGTAIMSRRRPEPGLAA